MLQQEVRESLVSEIPSAPQPVAVVRGLIAYQTSTFSLAETSADVPRARAGMMVSENMLGITIGGLISVGVARVLAAGLTGLGAPSPVTFVVAPVAVLIAAMVACYLPARRASLVDPIAALRSE